MSFQENEDKLLEELVIESFGKFTWDSFPNSAKKQIIESKKKELETDKRLKEMEEFEKKLKDEYEKQKREFEEKQKEVENKESELATRQTRVEEEKKEIEKDKKEVEKQAELLRSEAAAQQIAKKEVDFYRTEMFRIDRSTPSIDDMEITLSEPRIEESREYKEKGQYVMEQIMAKKMSGAEGRELLDGVFETLKRYMDAKRKREARRNPSTTTRKKVERDYERLKQKGWDKRDFGMEVVKETHTVRSDMYSVMIPDVGEFTDRALQMKGDMLTRQTKELDPQRIQHYCMASVALQGASDVSNTDCKNIARVIKWNDHVAVITAMKPVKKRLRVQTRRAIKVEASEENEVFVDIEAFSRTLSGNYTQQ
ncbi:hypothetical protein GGI17_006694, partial [Coemansia sp. S146]